MVNNDLISLDEYKVVTKLRTKPCPLSSRIPPAAEA